MPSEFRPASFKVTEHYELPGRGAFVIGHIQNGVFRPGTRVSTGASPAYLTVSGIEFLDNTAERTSQQALSFSEVPSIDFVRTVFPVGSTIIGADR